MLGVKVKVKEEIDKVRKGEANGVEIVVDLMDFLKLIKDVSAPSEPVNKLSNSNGASVSRIIRQQSSSKLVNAFPQ